MFYTHNFALAGHSNNTTVHHVLTSEPTLIVISTRMQWIVGLLHGVCCTCCKCVVEGRLPLGASVVRC